MDKEKKTVCIIDIAVPGDNRVGTKELEKSFKVPRFENGNIKNVDVKSSGSHTNSCWCPGNGIKKT